MRSPYFFLLTLLMVSLTSSSLAPLNTAKTGSTLGDKKWVIDTGIAPTYYGRVARGFGDNFELEGNIEVQDFPVLALAGKYSFINNKNDGFSLALHGGGFLALDVTDSTGAYVGPVASFRKSWLEVYANPRFNYVSWKGTELTADERDDLFVDILNFGSVDFTYMQYTLGFNFWFSEKFAFNINGKYMTFFGDDVSSDDEQIFLPGIAFIFRL